MYEYFHAISFKFGYGQVIHTALINLLMYYQVHE